MRRAPRAYDAERMKTPVYLDYNATTPVAPEVADAIEPYLREHFGNPSSSHAYAAARYDAWYHTPRGAWIGAREFELLRGALAPRPGETLLDVGCGTGYFSRLFAQRAGMHVVGLDPNLDWLGFARRAGTTACVAGRAERLPFQDASFDLAIAVTSLCFIRAHEEALREIVRVTRRRIALGLLNRRSLLYLQKGRHGGAGAYRGAQWHTPEEARALFHGLTVHGVSVHTGVFLPDAGLVARALERALSRRLLLGAFLLVVADVGA